MNPTKKICFVVRLIEGDFTPRYLDGFRDGSPAWLSELALIDPFVRESTAQDEAMRARSAGDQCEVVPVTFDDNGRTIIAPDWTPKAAHTPGPWVVARDSREVHGLDGYKICTLADLSTKNSDGVLCTKFTNYKANARLIAAAPELLESLRATLAAFKECVGAESFKEFEAGNLAVITAGLVIAKAEGQSS